MGLGGPQHALPTVMMRTTDQINVRSAVPLVSPREMVARYPMTETANKIVLAGREAVSRVLSGDDDRLIVVVGPCSIHDEAAAMEYAKRLAELNGRVADRI